MLAFRTDLGAGCTVRITLTTGAVATSTTPSARARRLTADYTIVGSGPNPAGTWVLGFSDGTKHIVHDGYDGPLARGLYGVSVLSTTPRRFLDFRELVTVQHCANHQISQGSLTDGLAGVLAYVHFQTPAEAHAPAAPTQTTTMPVGPTATVTIPADHVRTVSTPAP